MSVGSVLICILIRTGIVCKQGWCYGIKMSKMFVSEGSTVISLSHSRLLSKLADYSIMTFLLHLHLLPISAVFAFGSICTASMVDAILWVVSMVVLSSVIGV